MPYNILYPESRFLCCYCRIVIVVWVYLMAPYRGQYLPERDGEKERNMNLVAKLALILPHYTI